MSYAPSFLSAGYLKVSLKDGRTAPPTKGSTMRRFTPLFISGGEFDVHLADGRTVLVSGSYLSAANSYDKADKIARRKLLDFILRAYGASEVVVRLGFVTTRSPRALQDLSTNEPRIYTNLLSLGSL